MQFTGTHLYASVERGTVRIKCLDQEQQRNDPDHYWTQKAWSEIQR